ncbi:unnamed protein product [Cylicocyclus nassatus]|uniref:MADF domain-containing protein n=1 Tax=Cylicocyclus nassatus TaxID=53992 RepID=A0AA36HCS2_CYLNA|nr:unnamed protein product [Cylicocyclus nassatus]
MPVKFRETLASLVEDEPCLWDRTRDDYHMRDKKADAWDRIMNKLIQLGYTYDLAYVKNTWKLMRDAYRRYKISHSGSSASESSGIVRRLRYLETADVKGVRFSNLHYSDEDDDIDILNDENDPPPPEHFEEVTTSRTLLGVTPARNVGSLGKRQVVEKTKTTKKARLEEGISAVQEAADAVKSHLEAISSPTNKYRHIGDFVSDTLSGMTERKAHAKIQSLITVLLKDDTTLQGSPNEWS